MEIKQNYSLKSYHTFGVEASAKYFVEVNNEEELLDILQNPDFKNLPILYLGGGSNIFFTQDFNGILIKLNIKGITEEVLNEDEVLITAKAGENWHQFVLYCLEKNYGGLENLSFIPGNVGTCPIQNIGAYGVEIKDYFHSCKVLNLNNLQTEIFNKEDCNFGYRDSIFKQRKGDFVVLEVSFKLKTKNHILKTEYGAINQELQKMNISQPTIQDISRAVINIRESKLPDPKKIGNAGSFFKNPVVDSDTFQKLITKFPNIPHFPQPNGVKIPAGWLIEQSDWKGKQIGNVAVHQHQALVIINASGKASGKEIYDFSQQIIDSVKDNFGIELEREVNVV